MVSLENKEVLREIFEYLNGMQLAQAAQVCSFWNKVAQEEKKRRGPYCQIQHREITRPPASWIVAKRLIIDSCPIRPCLNIFFIATGCENVRGVGECHCKYLPTDCYSISLETFFPIENVNIIKSMFFPHGSKIRLSTVSLNEHSRVDLVYCKELNYEFTLDWSEKDRLKLLYDPFFTCDERHSLCMIFFCDQLSVKLADDVFDFLQQWYPSKNVIVWGGVLHDISICSTFDSVSNCKETINFISLLLSGRNMESWYMVLGPYHKKASRISYKFKTFTQSVHLRKHSVAFMFTSDTRGEKFYYLEIGLFEKHFPTVPLFKICGITALAGENIKDCYKKLSDQKKWLKGKETIFLIISYDN